MPHKDINERREYQRKYQQKWRNDNSDKWKGILSKSDKKRYQTLERRMFMKAVRHRKYWRKKIAVMEKYGKKCAYCGECRPETLTIDHIYDDGYKHKKKAEYKKTNDGGFWGVLYSIEYRPDLYQILCHNCNQIKFRFGIEPRRNKSMTFADWKKYSQLKEGEKE